MAEFNTLIITGTITATSNKGYSDAPVTDKSRKTAYVTVSNADEVKKLEDYGLTAYTSKDGATFFIIKLSNTVKLFSRETKEELLELPTDINSENIHTDKDVQMALTKGVAQGNTFYRIFALNVDNVDDVQNTVATNPFA